MTMLADIAVFECDKCRAVHVCKDKNSWEDFEKDWSESILHHFCPTCRHLPEISAILSRDREAIMEALARQEDAAPVAHDYAH